MRGVTGCCSAEVNGIYDPTDELSCGQPVYVKRGDSGKCIRFWTASGQWLVSLVSDKGKNSSAWASLKHSGRLEAASSMSDWQVTDGKVFSAQADVRVHVESAPVHMRAAAWHQSSASALSPFFQAETHAAAAAKKLADEKAAAEAQAKAAAEAKAKADADALAKAKAAAEAKAKEEALAAEQAKYAQTMKLLKELQLEKYSKAFMCVCCSLRSAKCSFSFALLSASFCIETACVASPPSINPSALRSQTVTDDMLPVTTPDQLVAHIGMTLGEAVKLKLAASSAAPMSLAGGGAAATGAVGSTSLSSSKPSVTSVVSSACLTCARLRPTYSLLGAAAPICQRRTLSRILQLQATVRSH